MTMLFLANAWGYLVAHWRTVAILAAILVIAIASILLTRSCGSKPKLNEAEIQKAQQAIAVEDRKQMVEILTSSDVREAAIDGNVSNAKADTVNAIHEARHKWQNATDDEIKAELERRLNQ
jgi:hypothetical protein